MTYNKTKTKDGHVLYGRPIVGGYARHRSDWQFYRKSWPCIPLVEEMSSTRARVYISKVFGMDVVSPLRDEFVKNSLYTIQCRDGSICMNNDDQGVVEHHKRWSKFIQTRKDWKKRDVFNKMSSTYGAAIYQSAFGRKAYVV